VHVTCSARTTSTARASGCRRGTSGTAPAGGWRRPGFGLIERGSDGGERFNQFDCVPTARRESRSCTETKACLHSLHTRTGAVHNIPPLTRYPRRH
jgi:hypothetical protein